MTILCTYSASASATPTTEFMVTLKCWHHVVTEIWTHQKLHDIQYDNFKLLNLVSDSFMPAKLFRSLAPAKLFSTVDLKDTYNWLQINEEDAFYWS